ncbi:ATP-grasp fold amidoligase family protein [Kaistia sp. MMO-174]|uniref:ATP-grasp fold amidoligase family protein n=1 Tax=Kaistia sp. MMO-174 TaxID=3081256 RepID=UPI00301A0819
MSRPALLARHWQSLRRRVLRKLRRLPVLGSPFLRHWHVRRYAAGMGELPRLAPPVTYSEHLLHRILFDRDPRLKIVSDKLAVRELIRERVGETFLVPLIGAWTRPEEIAWDSLPDRFVLKPNHGSGMVALVPDAARLDRAALVTEMRRWLRQDYFDCACEWGYRNLPRRIMAEALLTTETGETPPEVQVMTFHGRAVMMRILTGRKGRETRHANWFDTDGVELSLKSKDIPVGAYRLAPELARALADVAGRVAAGFGHLRVDVYLTDHGLKIGELTAYHASAIVEWNDPRFNELLGRCWRDPSEAEAMRCRAALRELRLAPIHKDGVSALHHAMVKA